MAGQGFLTPRSQRRLSFKGGRGRVSEGVPCLPEPGRVARQLLCLQSPPDLAAWILISWQVMVTMSLTRTLPGAPCSAPCSVGGVRHTEVHTSSLFLPGPSGCPSLHLPGSQLCLCSRPPLSSAHSPASLCPCGFLAI